MEGVMVSRVVRATPREGALLKYAATALRNGFLRRGKGRGEGRAGKGEREGGREGGKGGGKGREEGRAEGTGKGGDGLLSLVTTQFSAAKPALFFLSLSTSYPSALELQNGYAHLCHQALTTSHMMRASCKPTTTDTHTHTQQNIHTHTCAPNSACIRTYVRTPTPHILIRCATKMLNRV